MRLRPPLRSPALAALAACAVIALLWSTTAVESELLEKEAVPQKKERATVAVIVLPGDVVGYAPHDREKRLGAIAMGWGGRGLVSVVYVPDTSSTIPSRDGSFTPMWPLNASRGLGKFGVLRDVVGSVVADMDPDFIMLVHDHTFLIAENLLFFLHSLSPSHMIMTGTVLKINIIQPRTWFVSEPAGMVLSRATVAYFIRQWDNGKCLPPHDWARDNPSHTLAECFYDSGNKFTDSREYPGGHERFSIYGPVRTVKGMYDEWYVKYKNLTKESSAPCCATRPITFHYTDYAESLYWDRMVHGVDMGPYPAEIGGYASAPVGPEDPVYEYMKRKVRLA